MKAGLSIKVIESCHGHFWWSCICFGPKRLWEIKKPKSVSMVDDNKSSVVRLAKKAAEELGIPYDPEIIKLKGC